MSGSDASTVFLTIPAVGPVIEGRVFIKTEPGLPEGIIDQTLDGHSIPRMPLQRTDDFGAVRMATYISPGSQTSIVLKREAEDGLPEDESREDSKRIKQENLKQEEPLHREDSMPLYRQPSPYIIHRIE